jgi:hypothetical protein
MTLQLQRGGGLLIRKPVNQERIVTLLKFLGVPETEYLPPKHERFKYRGIYFYQYNQGRLDIILFEANRAWRRRVKALGDTSLCRELNDAWNRVKHLLIQAMNPKAFHHTGVI